MMDRIRGMDSDQYQQMSHGLARRFGDEGTPAYQNALAMTDQIRSMPEAQFRSQRADLERQISTGMASAQSAARAADTISADHAVDTWIQRYLLSPQTTTALNDLSKERNRNDELRQRTRTGLGALPGVFATGTEVRLRR